MVMTLKPSFGMRMYLVYSKVTGHLIFFTVSFPLIFARLFL